jgi:hypothetical protein
MLPFVHTKAQLILKIDHRTVLPGKTWWMDFLNDN